MTNEELQKFSNELEEFRNFNAERNMVRDSASIDEHLKNLESGQRRPPNAAELKLIDQIEGRTDIGQKAVKNLNKAITRVQNPCIAGDVCRIARTWYQKINSYMFRLYAKWFPQVVQRKRQEARISAVASLLNKKAYVH